MFLFGVDIGFFSVMKFVRDMFSGAWWALNHIEVDVLWFSACSLTTAYFPGQFVSDQSSEFNIYNSFIVISVL